MNAALPRDEDAELMLAFQRTRDEQCFDRLFQKHKASVINFAFRFTGRKDVAEELAQDIFVKCYMAAATYEPTARFRTWLFRIARNHCLNEVRRPDYRFRAAKVDEVDPVSSAPSPEEQASSNALRRSVERELALLPETQRTALLLAQLHGLSYEEIAETMETSVSAVKSLINRARTTLVKRLADVLEARHEL